MDRGSIRPTDFLTENNQYVKTLNEITLHHPNMYVHSIDNLLVVYINIGSFAMEIIKCEHGFMSIGGAESLSQTLQSRAYETRRTTSTKSNLEERNEKRSIHPADY